MAHWAPSACMGQLTVDQVVEAAQMVLNRNG